MSAKANLVGVMLAAKPAIIMAAVMYARGVWIWDAALWTMVLGVAPVLFFAGRNSVEIEILKKANSAGAGTRL